MACIGFAMPAVGNQALAALVRARGWERRLVNFLVPGEGVDQLPAKRTSHWYTGGKECGAHRLSILLGLSARYPADLLAAPCVQQAPDGNMTVSGSRSDHPKPAPGGCIWECGPDVRSPNLFAAHQPQAAAQQGSPTLLGS